MVNSGIMSVFHSIGDQDCSDDVQIGTVSHNLSNPYTNNDVKIKHLLWDCGNY